MTEFHEAAVIRAWAERVANATPVDQKPRPAGRIVACGDGVITIEGLRDVRAGELISVGEHSYALAMNLETDHVGAIMLDDTYELSEGDIAVCTGRIVSVPCGDALLGRVVDPLGSPLDGGPAIRTEQRRNIEATAPSIFDREKVSEPLASGITAIDSMVPIGKGQRELIIGDRQTGKTTIAVDTILNQKGKGVFCVYVAIGQKLSTVRNLVDTFEKAGAMAYTVVVCSTAGQPAPIQYIAPYTGTAIAEAFMYSGRDALIVYDDLSKHAAAYRTISLLLRRPSGREAYPGDVFYIHSRLLERSAHLHARLGGGSLTALPIVETLAGDISAYIPTNVISITDGQIYLENELFHAGMRPAINVGLSVSRVGGSAQCPAMRHVSARVRLELSHYREMAQFSQFGSDLDSNARATLDKGARLTEILKQPQHSPRPVSQMTAELSVMTADLLTGVTKEAVRGMMDGFYAYLCRTQADLIARIDCDGLFNDDDAATVKEALAAYRATL